MENSGAVYEADCDNCLKSIQVKKVENWKKEWKYIGMMGKNCEKIKG